MQRCMSWPLAFWIKTFGIQATKCSYVVMWSHGFNEEHLKGDALKVCSKHAARWLGKVFLKQATITSFYFSFTIKSLHVAINIHFDSWVYFLLNSLQKILYFGKISANRARYFYLFVFICLFDCSFHFIFMLLWF